MNAPELRSGLSRRCNDTREPLFLGKIHQRRRAGMMRKINDNIRLSLVIGEPLQNPRVRIVGSGINSCRNLHAAFSFFQHCPYSGAHFSARSIQNHFHFILSLLTGDKLPPCPFFLLSELTLPGPVPPLSVCATALLFFPRQAPQAAAASAECRSRASPWLPSPESD